VTVANAVSAFLDEPIAAGAGDRPAIVTASGTTTYRALLDFVSRAGHALRRLGVEPEQRVAILLSDSVEWVAVFLATLRIGAVAVPLNTRLGSADWITMLRDSRATALITEPAPAAIFTAARLELRDLERVITTAPAPECLALTELMRDAPTALDVQPVSAGDMAFWLYTSGTTGVPKAAVHPHRDLLACRHYGLEVLGATAADRVFATSKLFFAYALGNALLIPLFVGAQTFLEPTWADPALVARVMSEFRPTLFFSVPTFYARLARTDLPRGIFDSVRCAVSAGERLPEEIYWAMRQRYGVEVLDGMGTTETIFMVLANRPGQSRPGASGRPVPGTEARLLDAAGQEVGQGAEGILHVRTPSVSPFYWNRLPESRRAFVGEWFRTGDLYVRDADGFYYHRGRADELFKVAGMWVAPADVEAALLAHPDVAEAGVVGAPDTAGLVKPQAFVVPRRPDGAQGLETALARLCEEKLAPHQRPRKITVVAELPRTATGKLQRFLLRDRAP
jgi:benzoate-CoA ligase family protein